jgi:hypothetical protein
VLTYMHVYIFSLANLYNSIPVSSEERCYIATAVISYSSATNQVKKCKSFLLSMEAVVDTFNTTVEKKRTLYRAIANALKDVGDKEKEIMVYTLFPSPSSSLSSPHRFTNINTYFCLHHDSFWSSSSQLLMV